MRILYLFIDGIGVGPLKKAPENPLRTFARGPLLYPSLEEVRWPGEPTRFFDPKLFFKPVDPLLGYPGLPGSATGQTCLWTGVNAMKELGFHGAAIPGPTLKKIIEEFSIITRFTDAGKKAGFLNAYSDQYLQKIRDKPRFLSASTLIQKASGQRFLTLDDIKKEKAVFTDITHELLHKIYPDSVMDYPVADPRKQGRILMRAARAYDLSLFEYFQTDHAGHEQSEELATRYIMILESFLEGILEEIDPEKELLIITSDHGNMEDLSVATHTRNPVPVISYGKFSENLIKNVFDITDIPRFICRISGLN